MFFIKDKRTRITAILTLGIAVVLFVWIGTEKKEVIISENRDLKLGKQLTNNIEYSTIPVTVGKKVFVAEIVNVPGLRQLGLSGREALDPNSAMLFVFPKADRHSFWMKDMRFSIDIIWLDQDGEVVTIAKDVSPQTFPDSFVPAKDANYVIELPAGTASQQEIKIGDQIFFEKNLLKKSSN